MSEIIIVSGLPRSGTSLMMQLLKNIPLEIASDNVRTSDINNLDGYYELEAVKGIVRSNEFLYDCIGKVVKIVAPLTQFIDLSHKYKVILMRREMEEILMSQEKMLGKDQSNEREKFKSIYELHLKKTYQFFETNMIPFIEIEYKELIENPIIEIERLFLFLNVESDPNELVKCVNSDYYRNRIS
jgi:hypothetical protein